MNKRILVAVLIAVLSIGAGILYAEGPKAATTTSPFVGKVILVRTKTTGAVLEQPEVKLLAQHAFVVGKEVKDNSFMPALTVASG